MWWLLIAAIVLLCLSGVFGWALLWLERRAHQRTLNALNELRDRVGIASWAHVERDMKERLKELRARNGEVA